MELMGVLLGNIDFLMFKIIFEKNFWDNVFVLILFFLEYFIRRIFFG